MDELIKLISNQVGVTPDKAQRSRCSWSVYERTRSYQRHRRLAKVRLSHIKGKAPALSSQLDGLMGGGAAAGGLGDVAGKLGGLMGGQ